MINNPIADDKSKLRVAIVQHRIDFGGRLNVIVHMIKYLNELKIIPYILTFTMNDITKEDINKYYHLKIDYNLVEIKETIKFPHDLQILFFNVVLKKFRNKFDFFIDSNNTTYLMPHIPILSYVHFPRKYRMMSKHINIHDFERGEKGWFKGKREALEKLTQTIYRFNIKCNELNAIVCNSEFSKKCFKEVYHRNKRDIAVIYPPVVIKLNGDDSIKENSVITLGRFGTSKKQLEQIKIAERLKDVDFHIIGFTEMDNYYYLNCLDYVRANNIRNVFFHVNASYNNKRELTKSAKILLHTTENEPFGITIVEGIMDGCLPLVPDSGGQREIVFLEDLRYKRLEEVIKIIEKIIEGKINYTKYIQLLQKHIKNYDHRIFMNRFDDIFKKFIYEYVNK
jgi:hypothetical protein